MMLEPVFTAPSTLTANASRKRTSPPPLSQALYRTSTASSMPTSRSRLPRKKLAIIGPVLAAPLLEEGATLMARDLPDIDLSAHDAHNSAPWHAQIESIRAVSNDIRYTLESKK